MNTHLRNEFALIFFGNILLVGLIAADIQGISNPVAIVRLLLGLIYVLYIPGYALQLFLFPRKEELDPTERIALSFALSGVIIPPIVLILNWSPWGIRLWPIVISLSIIILASMIGATIRQRLLRVDESTDPKPRPGLRKWWAEQERGNRVVYIILSVILATAFVTAFSILATPKPAERFTEFYILGQERLAEDYPREMIMGQILTITTGITNREGITSTYSIQIKSNDQVIGQAGPITLENKATWEQAVEFTVAKVGDDQQITFILNREGQPAPYRTLQLWINVKPAQAP